MAQKLKPRKAPTKMQKQFYLGILIWGEKLKTGGGGGGGEIDV